MYHWARATKVSCTYHIYIYIYLQFPFVTVGIRPEERPEEREEEKEEGVVRGCGLEQAYQN